MRWLLVLVVLLFSIHSFAQAREITDALGRKVNIPDSVQRVICSGSGCLRLLSYLGGQDKVVAVDDIEGRRNKFDARPYALANPQYKNMPVFGEFRGKDNPELIMTLDPAPEVIIKLVGTGKGTVGMDPDTLQGKVGIPVVAVKYGNLAQLKGDLYAAIRLMGQVIDKEQRAEEVLNYIDAKIADLRQRTERIPEADRPTVYLGGVAYAGPHGFQSTEPTYPPFQFINVNNLVADSNAAAKDVTNTDIAKEQIVAWNPDYLFLDLSTLQLGEQAGGLHELKTDPAYQVLEAVQQGRVYGVLPYNWYNQNFESILANAYFIGSVLYSEHFADIDPARQADEIYTFFVGKPVFGQMKALFQDRPFSQIELGK